jgi:hypothetical protein
MTALLGHLMELDFTSDFKTWSHSTIPQLFNAQIIKQVKKAHKSNIGYVCYI